MKNLIEALTDAPFSNWKVSNTPTCVKFSLTLKSGKGVTITSPDQGEATLHVHNFEGHAGHAIPTQPAEQKVLETLVAELKKTDVATRREALTSVTDAIVAELAELYSK